MANALNHPLQIAEERRLLAQPRTHFPMVVTTTDVTGADGRLLVAKSAVGIRVGDDQGIARVFFLSEPRTFVELDGSGLRIQSVPLCDLAIATPGCIDAEADTLMSDDGGPGAG